MTLRNFFRLDFLNNTVAMGLAMIVSLGTVTLTFVLITPPFFYHAAQVIIGIMGMVWVLFSPRAISIKKFGLWRTIAGVIVFCEVSLFMTLTNMQAHDTTKTVQVDPVLAHLQKATNDAQTNLTNLIDQQAKAQTRPTLDALAAQITVATQVYQESAKAERSYHSSDQSGPEGIDPDKLFMAIPNALMSLDLGQYMKLALSIIIATVFQLVILATVTATVKSVKRNERAEAGPRKRRRRRKITEPVEPVASEPESILGTL